MKRSAIPRLGVLWCPNWAVVAAQAALDEPVVGLHAKRVIAQSLAAGREGVAVGQRRRQAQACCPHPRLVAHDPHGDARRVVGGVPAVGAGLRGGGAAMADRMTSLASSTVSGSTVSGAEVTCPALDAVGGFGMGVADG